MEIDLESAFENSASQKKKNIKRFKGENREGYVNQRLTQENDAAVNNFKKRMTDYQVLVEKKLPKIGLKNEEDLLKYLCDYHLIDRIPDDYEGYMQKVKSKLATLNTMNEPSEHMSIKGMMAKLSANIKSFIDQKRQENRYLMGMRKDEEYVDELDKLELFKKHKRNKDVIAEKFYIYKKIKDWAVGKNLHITEQIKRDLQDIGDKIFKYDAYFHKVKLLNDEISSLRGSIHQDRVFASKSDLTIKAELKFANQVLTQYQDDSQQIIQEIDNLLQSVNKKFLF